MKKIIISTIFSFFIAFTTFAQNDSLKTQSYPQNLIHIDILAPLMGYQMYGGTYERVFNLFSGPRSFLVGFGFADEIKNPYGFNNVVKAKDLMAVGILTRNYYNDLLSWFYYQYGISYFTGEVTTTEYNYNNEARHQKYDLNGGGFQFGTGLQFLIGRVFLIDVGISYGLFIGNLDNKRQGEDTDDELLFGSTFGITGNVGFAF